MPPDAERDPLRVHDISSRAAESLALDQVARLQSLVRLFDKISLTDKSAFPMFSRRSNKFLSVPVQYDAEISFASRQ
jgi:hypothetical protein